MAGAYETCNHLIACLYKVDYANTKGFCNPSCTEQACADNQDTKKEVVPKRIAELFVRKKLSSSENKIVDKTPDKEVRMKDLSAFDPKIESHRQFISDDVSNFSHKIQIINKNAVLFKSIETCDTTVCSDFSSLIVQNIKEKVL